MKKLVALAIATIIVIMTVGAFSGLVRAQSATVWTDKADYTPGETVSIFGSGFNPLANVNVTIERPDETDDMLFVVADDVGNFACTYQLDGIEGTYTVTAADGTNTATTTFTDYAYLILWATDSSASYFGSYVEADPDPWINYTWVVGSDVYPGSSVSFDLYVEALSDSAGWGGTYNVYLAIAVSDPTQIASITVGSTTITTFAYGTASFPSGAGGGTVPAHGIYPAWYALVPFGSVASNHGYYTPPNTPYPYSYWAYRAHTQVTITMSNTMNAGFRVHFDGQGVMSGGAINTVRVTRDLTFVGSLLEHYLTVVSPFDTPGGEGWYPHGSYAYATLATGTVSGGAGVQYVFTGWSGDASGSGLTSNAILMDGSKTAVANWKTQYSISFSQAGLDGSASGTVATITVGSDPPVTKPYNELPFNIWVDSGTSINYAYTNPVSSITPKKQFWLSGVTGPASSFIVDSSVTVNGNYLLLPYSQVTTSSLCYLDLDPSISGQQFRLIFTQNISSPGTYKLPASNPGQFYYNVFYIGTPGSTATFTITIPYPFVTQGAVPVHVYGSLSILGGCFVPSDELGGFIITSASTITVSGQVPESGLVYVTVHLDYGLKGTYGYTKNSNNDALIGNVKVIPNLGFYTFSVSGALSDSQMIQNMNVFKRDPGFAGLVTDSYGNPIKGVKVQIYGPSGKLLATVYTDADGYYSYAYKYTGKAATFTIKLPDYNLVKPVTVKSNSLAEVNFKI